MEAAIDRPPALYPILDAAQVLGIGKTKTFELIRAGELETVRIGRRRLIPAAAIDEYVDRLRGH
jgi:excisionase family DNA binding protein